MGGIEKQLARHKETAADIHTLRADVESLTNVLNHKAKELEALTFRSAQQNAEIQKLQALVPFIYTDSYGVSTLYDAVPVTIRRDDGSQGVVLTIAPVSSPPTETPPVAAPGGGLSKEAIPGLLKTMAVADHGGKDADLCAICLDDLHGENKRDIGVLECRHQFHTHCIGEWLSRKNECPLCKAVGINVP